ncbi:MAG: hypothetical protein H0W09_04200, partial [Solirubrobacterales bacterium]|nr:hypothetical protein [Solirubrobacterales bacterium]
MAGTVYKRQPGTPNERVAGFVGTLPGRDELLDAAERQRARLYLVGGAVRDLILGGRAVDVDLAVEGDAIALADLLDP